MIKRGLSIVFAIVFFVGFASGFEFNGTVLDVNGNALNNSLINITIRNSDFTVNGTNHTYANETGWFNLSVTDITDAFYELSITFTNASTGAVQYIGQNLPSFPSQVFIDVAGTTFYLQEAGTFNITAINATGDRITFNYQIKDQRLGYSVATHFSTYIDEAVINVPKNRNYSILIYPFESMPVSIDWTNFSETTDYDVNGLSSFNSNTTTLHYQFNTTLQLVRVTGYINFSGISGWDEFSVVPWLLEPGNMIETQWGDLPYNLSSVNGGTDIFTSSSGFYNMTLPATAESSSMLLMATARNGTGLYGGFKNLSLSYGTTGLNDFNFTAITGLMGIRDNITMSDLSTGGDVNITTGKQFFALVNESNNTLQNANAHIETTVDYSDHGALEFTWVTFKDQGASPVFGLPLLNTTNIKEMNVYAGGGDYAPKKISLTIADLETDNLINNISNITLTTFNPGDIDGQSLSITMSLYISNSSCDVPDPADACVLGGTSEETDFDSFDPFQAIIGGGKISFRMGTSGSSGVKVHYVNVDMLASGPPDALFDDSADEATGDVFESALRFGSQGPTIFDYALIGMPYTEGSETTTGLDESSEVNMSIPLLYDDDWNVIWNVTANGSDAGALAGNYSHYSLRQEEWGYLMNVTTCHTNATAINSTQPCYIDTGNNVVWLRIPHFSGTGPSLTGSVITATSGTTTGGSSGGGGGSSIEVVWQNTFVADDEELENKGEILRSLKAKERIRVKIGNEKHHVGVKEIKDDSVVVSVASEEQEATLKEGENAKFDVNGDYYYDVKVSVLDIGANSVEIRVEYVNEAVPENGGGGEIENEGAEGVLDDVAEVLKESGGKSLLWIIIVIAVLTVVFFVWKKYNSSPGVKRKRELRGHLR